MPERAKHPCNQPGCPQLTNERYCEQHQRNNVQAAAKRQYDKSRKDDPYRRLYDTAQWRRTRKSILARDVLCTIGKKCVEKYGVVMPSEVVDHIVAVRDGGSELDEANLRGCCKSCHDWRTVTENGGLGKKKG